MGAIKCSKSRCIASENGNGRFAHKPELNTPSNKFVGSTDLLNPMG